MPKYTLTFSNNEERKFSDILSRLDPEKYTVIESVKTVDQVPPRGRIASYPMEKQSIIDMDADTALLFRMSMKNIKVSVEKSEEEMKAEEKRNERHKIKVTVKVPPASET